MTMAIQKIIGAATISVLLLLVGCHSPAKDWTRATTINTEQGYKDFLARYPTDPRASEAKRRVSDLLENSAWTSITDKANRAAFAEFLNRFPNGKHARDAQQSIRDLHVCRAISGGDVALTTGIGKLVSRLM